MKIAKQSTILVLGCLGSCTHSAPPASEAEKTAALTDYVNCVDKAVQQLDDGKSDASTIALGAGSNCAAQYSWSISVTGSGMNPAEFVLYREKMQRDQVQITIGIVLRARASRAQQGMP